MRRIILLMSVVALAFCWLSLAPTSLAWEFELQGAFNWTHEWYSQQGSKGFLGLTT